MKALAVPHVLNDCSRLKTSGVSYLHTADGGACGGDMYQKSPASKSME